MVILPSNIALAMLTIPIRQNMASVIIVAAAVLLHEKQQLCAWLLAPLRILPQTVPLCLLPTLCLCGKIGPHKIDRQAFDPAQIDQNPFFLRWMQMQKSREGYLDDVRKSGSSAGAILELLHMASLSTWPTPC